MSIHTSRNLQARKGMPVSLCATALAQAVLSWLPATEASPTTFGRSYDVHFPSRKVQFSVVSAEGELGFLE